MARTGSRASQLEFAVLGLLQESPLHGYELRKRLGGVLGAFRAISFGSLYPCLRGLEARGLIATADDLPGSPAPSGRRGRIVYQLTAEGKEHFAELIGDSGPDTWDDEAFGVRLAFFGRADADVRRHILEGRRSRLEERLATLRASLRSTRERLDSYTLELQRHGLESVEREMRWIDDLLAGEVARTTTSQKPSETSTPQPDQD